jgi:hypothetical protein
MPVCRLFSVHDTSGAGMRTLTCLRMVRQVFHLSLIAGQAVMMKADTGVAPQEHEERLIPGLKQALQETEEESHA